jgi:transposase
MNSQHKSKILISQGFTPIPLFDGYWCNEEGLIASSANRERESPRVLSPLIINSGYQTVQLEVKGSKPKRVTVHRLIALTFIPNPFNYECIDHLDSNKLNNHVSNLEWVTAKANTRRCIERGGFPSKKGEFGGKCKLTELQVKDIYRRMEDGESTSNLAKEYCVGYNAIRAIFNGTNWSHLGLTPQFKGKAKGEKAGSASLKDTQVVEIKILLANGNKASEIARQFNVSKSCIQHIKMGRSRK